MWEAGSQHSVGIWAAPARPRASSWDAFGSLPPKGLKGGTRNRSPMETIATRLPRGEVARVDKLVAVGWYVSRSEALRDALRRLLDAEGCAPSPLRSPRTTRR